MIVTIHNSEKYLKRLFKSIDEQIDKNFELILINDNSTDNSEKICLEYMKKNEAQYIKKKCNGVSAARNCGIEHSNGNYICFIDSDDLLSKEYILDFNKSIKEQPDCVCCKYMPIKEENINTKINPTSVKKQIKKKKKINSNDVIFSGYGGYIWNKLLKKEIIIKNNLKFDKKITMCEDMLFLHEYMKYCKKTILLDSVNYYYIVSKKSLSKNEKNIGWYTNFKVYETILKEKEFYSDFSKKKIIYEFIVHLYEGKYRAIKLKNNDKLKLVRKKLQKTNKADLNMISKIKILLYAMFYKIIFAIKKR